MKAGKKHKRKTGILVGVCITVLIVTALLYFVYGKERTFSGVNPQNDDGLVESDLARIADEHYNSVMISMRSTKGISEEDFSYYRAMEAFIASHTILNTKELSQYLDEIINSGNQVTTICLGLDPELLWIDAGQKKTDGMRNLKRVFILMWRRIRTFPLRYLFPIHILIIGRDWKRISWILCLLSIKR